MPKSKYSQGLEEKRYGRWTVKAFAYSRRESAKSFAFFWICLCDCGEWRVVNARIMARKMSASCGCLKSELVTQKQLKHGHNRPKTSGHSPEYRSWDHMNQRTRNPKNNPAWHRYGGRGIVVCQGFRNFSHFLQIMGRKPTIKHSIDRVNNDGNYSCGECAECIEKKWPFNCRWATAKEQAANTCRAPKYRSASPHAPAQEHLPD